MTERRATIIHQICPNKEDSARSFSAIGPAPSEFIRQGDMSINSYIHRAVYDYILSNMYLPSPMLGPSTEVLSYSRLPRRRPKMDGEPTIQLGVEAIRTLAASFVPFVGCNLALHSIPAVPTSESSSNRSTIMYVPQHRIHHFELTRTNSQRLTGYIYIESTIH
jgi:hypothetical protein